MSSDEDKEISEETRSRRMTEKGLEWDKDIKSKKIDNIFKQLKKEHQHIETVITSSTISKESIEDLRCEYAKWLKLYDILYEVREEYSDLLKEPDLAIFRRECCSQDSILINLKTKVDQYFIKFGATQRESDDWGHISVAASKKSSVISRGSHSSLASSISSAQLQEKQRKAELMAKAKALKEKQKLDIAKLEIKMKEEELELRTQIDISEAKSKVLNSFESGQDVVGYESEIPLNTIENSIEMKHDEIKDVSFGQVNNRAKLNPTAPLFIPAVENAPHIQMDADSNVIKSVVQQLRKPNPDIQKFSGDPLQYQKFKRQFNTKIVMNSDNDDEKMSYLEQFTTGEAYRVVKGYGYLDASKGYIAACKELEERYGNEEAVASALIKRALNWPSVKYNDAKALDEYAIFLSECENAVSTISAVRVLEYPDNLRKLVMKLPSNYHEKWRNNIQRIRTSGKIIEFHDLVKFVKEEAKKVLDPMYGKEAMYTDDKPQPCSRKPLIGTPRYKPKGSFATNITRTDKMKLNISANSNSVSANKLVSKIAQEPCIYCSEHSHAVDSCDKLVSKPHVDRLAFLRSKGVCFRCLIHGHMSKDCDKRATCRSCGGNHLTVLHMDREVGKGLVSACIDLDDSVGMNKEAGEGECTLAIIPVKVTMKNCLKVVETYAFLDPGSTVSFCSESLVKKLGCSGKKMEITIDTMGKPHTMHTYTFKGLQVCDLDEKNVISLPMVYTKDCLPVTSKHIPSVSDVSRWPHLQDINLPKIDSDVGLLIGGNVPDAYSPFEFRTGPAGSPHATRTRIGWIIWNMIRSTPQETRNRFQTMRTEIIAAKEVEELKELDKMIRKSMNFDFPEKTIDDKKEMSQEDKKFVETIMESMNLQNGQYHIKLPFRDENVRMPDNRKQALQRLCNLKKKFGKDPKFHDDYKTFMNDVIDKGYAEKVPEEKLEGRSGRLWYIPHHGIYHPRKPGKIRVVFDCAASYQGVSLNNVLLQGPDLTSNLIGILMRFRQEPIAVMGDIESMFYRVRVPQEDSDFQRFFWWPDGNFHREPEVYRMLVHLFGSVSSSSCATFALQQIASDRKHMFDAEIIDLVKTNFYVDDCLVSVATEDKAISLVKEVSNLCMEGGFRLTKWISNSHSVIKTIPIEERAKDVKQLNLECEKLPSERALGVFWFVESDSLGFKIHERIQPNTRRGILSIVSSVYDPLGFVAPFVLLAKQLLQNLCKKEIGWDDEIDDVNLKSWQQWQMDLPKLEKIQIDRCYKPKDFGIVVLCQLHVFTDASDSGYGVVAYLRLTNENNDVHCALIMAKSRVAPLKKITIPRMELTASTVGVRLSKVITDELQYNIDETYFWTDSMSVLRYIGNNTSRFQTFVANRIALIRESTEVRQWRYINSKCNPADCASRGMSFDKFLQHEEWFDGPTFLRKPQEEWPQVIEIPSVIPNDDPEVKKSVNCALANRADTIDKLFNYYSSWSKLKKAVGWIILIMNRLHQKATKRKELQTELKIVEPNPVLRHELVQKKMETITFLNETNCESDLKQVFTSDTLKKAEKALIRHIQAQHFKKELKSMSDKEPQKGSSTGVGKHSSLYKLDPFLSDGVIRVGGRLERAHIHYDMKHPVVLPKNCIMSKLILEEIHKLVGHMGKNAMLSLLRQSYWILGARTLIKGIVSKCVVCRKYQAPPGEQKMADLPEERLKPDLPPFSHVGMDYFGPFLVKRGRSCVKRYGVIFTCLNIRAIHLEVASYLDTDSCINAIRRFIARRGLPKLIRSDNGTNLVGSERELREELSKLNQMKLHSTLLKRGIDWYFNTPAASHHGGVWERMIRSVRKILYSIMQEQTVRLDDEGLYTLFSEVEAILNGRPITDVPCDPHDLSPLTPNHLLLLRSGDTMPPGVFNKVDSYCRRRWRQVQYLADLFWKRWIKEYLPILQDRQKWLTRKRNLAVGDIVLVMNSSPRNAWSLGRITEVLTDKKGLVRTAKLKTASSELVRPVDKLCVILSQEE